MATSRTPEQKLREAFALVADSLTAAGYPGRVRDAYELLDVGEPGVALENMCENLYEFECRIPRGAYQLFEEAGGEMKVKSRYWEILGPQVVE